MNITKLGHCCLLIETKGKKILTDPGSYTTAQTTMTGIDVVLITHEHGDHFHVASVQEILKNNPDVVIITNTAVGKLLDAVAITHTILDGRNTLDSVGIILEAFDARHEEIFEEIGQVQNTGYFIDNKLFYPGDAFHNPNKPVDVLALPVAGPWCKIPDAIRYALAVKPRIAFPVHDGALPKGNMGSAHGAPKIVLPQHGIEFIPMVEGDSKEF